MTLYQVFTLIYYSHITLVALSMVLTASISAVVYHQFDWQVILLVGFSTYFTYSLDNLIDWKRDIERYRDIQTFIRIYHKISYILMPAAAIGIISLTLLSPNELRTGILLLGAAVAMGTSRFPIYRNNSSSSSQSITRFFINRLFISIIWTTVCVFLPIWYRNNEVLLQTWHAYIYTFCLILPYAVIWKLEASYEKLRMRVISSKIIRILILLPIAAMTLVVIDEKQGLFPTINLVNLLPPTAMIAGLVVFQKQPNNAKLRVFTLTQVLILLCGISALSHILFG